MRLGVISESSANAYYRALFPMRALERRGHTVVWPSKDGRDASLRDLAGCELVHCYRRMDRLPTLRELARYGVAISFDNDDDYFAAEVSLGGTGLEGRRHNSRLARMTVDAAELADLMTTTSDHLAERYRAAGVRNIEVIGNHLDETMPGFGSRSKHEGIVLGWVAETEHLTELERLPIASVFRELLTTEDDLRVVSVGLRVPLALDRYEHIPRVPFMDLLEVTRTFDIGIAPLADTPFNRARSDVKLKEYGSGGAAWLASRVGPYRDHGEAHGGLLVADDEWLARCAELVRNARKRRRLARRALRWAKGQTIDRQVDRWESVFLEAIERVELRARRSIAGERTFASPARSKGSRASRTSARLR